MSAPAQALLMGGSEDRRARLILALNGSNGSTSFPDTSIYARSVTAVGNAQISTAQSVFGGASALFDGAGDYLTVPDSSDLKPHVGNWTFGCRFRPNTVAAGDRNIFTKRASNAVFSPIQLRASGGILDLKASQNGSSWAISTTGGTLVANTWHHLELVINGTSVKVYLNGNAAASGTLTAALMDNSSAWVIGGDTNANYLNGYLDDIYWLPYALHTANFTPPTSAYADP